MTNVSTTNSLPNDLRGRVNRLAHAAALKHELETKDRLLADLQRMRAAGADLRQLHNFLDNQ